MATAHGNRQRVPHGDAVPLADIPLLEIGAMRAWILDEVAEGGRVAALFGRPLDAQTVRLYGVVTHTSTGAISIVSADVNDEFESLTPECPQVHGFEREIAEQWGVVPRGHPWLKPIRFHTTRARRLHAQGTARDRRARALRG